MIKSALDSVVIVDIRRVRSDSPMVLMPPWLAYSGGLPHVSVALPRMKKDDPPGGLRLPGGNALAGYYRMLIQDRGQADADVAFRTLRLGLLDYLRAQPSANLGQVFAAHSAGLRAQLARLLRVA